MHLYSFRKGWENENLARFILSRFSLIAHPATVSDDVGTDFFCTIFLVEKIGRARVMRPTNSFAVQVKSNLSPLDLTGKQDYLSNIEMPYFIGVVEQKEMSLTLYSGQYLPIFLSTVGNISKLTVELLASVNDRNFCQGTNGEYTLFFPKVLEIRATEESAGLEEKARTLSELCSTILLNISHRKTNQFVFKCPSGYFVLAGKDSARAFRDNFKARLAEVFANLEWILINRPEDFSRKEFDMYETFLNEIDAFYGQVPIYLGGAFVNAKESLKNKAVTG